MGGTVDWTGGGRLVLVITAFDRCAVLSIWKAEGPNGGPRLDFTSYDKKRYHSPTLTTLCYITDASIRYSQNIFSAEEKYVLGQRDA